MRPCPANFRYLLHTLRDRPLHTRPGRRVSGALLCLFLLVSTGCVERDDNAAPAISAPVAMAPPPTETVTPLPLPPPDAASPPTAPAGPSPEAASLGLGNKTSIALLLPLTGANAGLGADMQDAALLATSQLGGAHLAIVAKDTAGTPEGAAEAARQVIADGAKLILGPLTAAETEAVRPVAAASNVNVVAFSNVARIAGGGVYVMGFLPEQEIARVISYAHSTGIDHVALIAPSDAYGQLAADAYVKAATQAGITADPPELYQSDLSDLPEVLRHIGAKGQFTFTALMLPTGGAALKQVSAQLSATGIVLPKARLLGTSLWDADHPGNEPTLVGGWYAAPSKASRARFEQSFAAAYGHPPQRLASLAYDAVALSAVLSRSTGDFSGGALTNSSGFAGADGLFRLKADGTNERGLAVLQVEANGVSTISPAPDSFQGVGQ